MRTRSSWIWCWIVGAVLASGAGAQQYTTIIDNLPDCVGNRNGRIIAVSDATSDSDCTTGGATGEDRFVHPCICDTLNALGPYWKAVGGGSGGSGDVVGPASSTDNAIARFDGTTGKLLQNTSAATIADNGGIFVPEAYVGGATAATAEIVMDAGNIYLGSGVSFGWASAATPDGAAYALDTKLGRSAASIVKVTSALHLDPLASPPRTCDATAEGDLYSDTSHALCWCDASAWQKLSGAGTCA